MPRSIHRRTFLTTPATALAVTAAAPTARAAASPRVSTAFTLPGGVARTYGGSAPLDARYDLNSMAGSDGVYLDGMIADPWGGSFSWST